MGAHHDFRFLHWGRMPDCGAVLEKYFTGYHSLQLITRGSVRVSYDDENYQVGGTCFWFHFPGPLIRLRSADPQATWSHRYVAFRGEPCAAWANAGLIALSTPIHCPVERRGDLVGRLDEILGWLGQSGPAPAAKARALLEVLLWELWEIRRSTLVRVPGSDRNQRPLPEAVADFAATQRFHVGAYPRLARELGISLTTLRRRIHEATGLPLHRYTRSLRLAEARRLLRTTERTLEDIAETLGFADAYYFNREFTRLAGISPGAWRKSIF